MTKDKIMALADAYASSSYVDGTSDAIDTPETDAARAALQAALTEKMESLTPEMVKVLDDNREELYSKTEKQEPVLWVNPNLDRVTTDRKLAEKNGLYIPLYAGPTCKQDLQVPTVRESLTVQATTEAKQEQWK